MPGFRVDRPPRASAQYQSAQQRPMRPVTHKQQLPRRYSSSGNLRARARKGRHADAIGPSELPTLRPQASYIGSTLETPSPSVAGFPCLDFEDILTEQRNRTDATHNCQFCFVTRFAVQGSSVVRPSPQRGRTSCTLAEVSPLQGPVLARFRFGNV